MYHLIRPILFLLPPESAHAVTEFFLYALGWLIPRPRVRPFFVVHFWGRKFRNPLGMAAGFDKYARLTRRLLRLGFGFIESGSFTLHPQTGHARPRLFRLTQARALVNRMGFNNCGVGRAAARLRGLAQHLRIGVSIGVNADSQLRPADMIRTAMSLAPHATYVVFNLSSPNTQGLRDLQTPEVLKVLVHAVREAYPHMPIFLKLAPDLSDADVMALVQAALDIKATGLVIGNTTNRRPDGLGQGLVGGLSGPACHARSVALLKLCYRQSRGKLLLIGVGGLETGQQAYEKIRAGASLLQLYTGLIYWGPFLPRRILHELETVMRKDGWTHYQQAIGVDVP